MPIAHTVRSALLGLSLVACNDLTPPTTSVSLRPAGAAWTETFDTLDTARWEPSSWGGFWQRPGLTGRFDPALVSVKGGHLLLTLTVQSCATGLCARAAEVQTHQTFGFGRYTYRFRAASTSAHPARSGKVLSGNISGAFSYVNDSATEIDLEIEGNRPRTLNTAVWRTVNSKTSGVLPTSVTFGQSFQTMTYEWRPDRVTYFLNGSKVWETTQDVPQDAAHIMLNVWPTNSAAWGGPATRGTVHMLVDSISFEPF
ncbi:glycoside hydrolase family 16 protein [Deinococcus sedimenti]|uniref:Endo-1,3-1,4-beta-glycanase ExoK n=1 Tax=Deinococcus sedimenti TaxID=1867090 RepID=A0ABQ2RZ73_9DEIO|nr:glycoside hydrolase family 16 protein [Deinococcus sedimenti]GGR82409.1 endo-1,3-1,4-beta-glycanase ExoK [Deinococcus sedimenti]